MGRDVFGLGDVQANPTKVYYFHPPFFSQKIRAKSMQRSLYPAGSDASYRKGFANLAQTTASHTRTVTPRGDEMVTCPNPCMFSCFIPTDKSIVQKLKSSIHPFLSTAGHGVNGGY